MIERGRPVPRVDNPNTALPYDADSGHNHGQGLTTLHLERSTSTLGWLPACGCYGIPAMPDLPDEPETPEGIEAGAGAGDVSGLRGPRRASRGRRFPDDATVSSTLQG